MSRQLTFGETVLNDMKEGHHISQKDFQFVCEETTFLTHMNMMTDRFSRIPYATEENLLKYWQFISKEFPKNKKYLFWKLFVKSYDSIFMEF